MKNFILLFLLNILSIAAFPQRQGQILEVKVPVPHFKNSLLVENDQQTVFIYLPPSYNIDTLKRYPSVYFLPGFGGNPAGFGSMDQLIGTGKIKEMIYVSPNGASRLLIASFYANSPVMGNWDDYISQVLVNYVDTHYRTIPKAEARAISGHSMGGFGALNLSMLHPDVFCIGWGIAPGLFNETGLLSSQILTSGAKTNHFNFVESVKGLTRAEAHEKYLVFIKKISANSDNLFAVAYGSAFSADTSLIAPYINYPYSKNGTTITTNSVYLKNYDNGFGNLKEKTVTYKSNFEKLKGFVIEYGKSDEYSWIPPGCVYFDKVLTEASIHHELHPYIGDHSTQMGNRIMEYLLPYCSTTLAFDTAHFNTQAAIETVKLTRQVGAALLNVDNKTIHLTVPSTVDLTKVKPAIYVSPGAKITPASNIVTDFSTGSVTYTLISEDGKKSETWTVFIAKETTSVKSFNGTNEFKLYPNPAINRIYLTGVKLQCNVQITDIQGNIVLKTKTDTQSSIDISMLKRGPYFLNALDKGNKLSIEFLVK